jgi:hypothetical protein
MQLYMVCSQNPNRKEQKRPQHRVRFVVGFLKMLSSRPSGNLNVGDSGPSTRGPPRSVLRLTVAVDDGVIRDRMTESRVIAPVIDAPNGVSSPLKRTLLEADCLLALAESKSLRLRGW